jgi:hypothetical protein
LYVRVCMFLCVYSPFLFSPFFFFSLHFLSLPFISVQRMQSDVAQPEGRNAHTPPAAYPPRVVCMH